MKNKIFNRESCVCAHSTQTRHAQKVCAEMRGNMLTGKVAVITGASRGIGRATAIELAKRGAFVIVNYRGSEAAALETVAEIKSAGGDAVCMAWDVSDYAECEKNIKQIIDTFGRIDILVNNAGITRDDLLMKLSEEDFDAVIAANLKGTFCMLHFVSRQMLRQRSGKIINLASVVGICGNAGQVNYAASKAGVIGMTKSAAKELASRNITVNAVAPGWIETDMTKNLSDAARERMLSAIPLKKPGTAKQVAGVIAFLASEDADYITGQVLQVDGGMLM